MTIVTLPLRSDVPQPIRDPNGCLIWQGRIDGNGYGKLGRDGFGRQCRACRRERERAA